MKDIISVIVPVYNAERWLKKCIESIISQTYKDLEIILINDGSTDKSREICDEYEKLDNRIKVIHKKNEGVSIARNTGLSNSIGEYIQFVDSDDWIEKQMCEMLINTMKKEKSDLVLCGLNIFKHNEILRKPALPKKTINFKESEEYYWFLRKINLGPCNKLYKKLYITKQFEINKSLGEDTIFVLDYMKNISIVSTVESCLYNVRLDNEYSLNRKKREDRLDLVLSLRDDETKYFVDFYGEKCDKKLLNNEYILAIHSCFRDAVKDMKKNDALMYINKYINKLKSDINNISNNTSFARKDYKIFNIIIKYRNSYLIYSFFKAKLTMEKLRGGK